MTVRAVFFDVDFTLIYPGPTFRGEGYEAFCARHGMTADPSRFEHAVMSAAPLLDGPDDVRYDAGIFVAYTRHIIEQMGGRGENLDACAREIYEEWATNQHFEMYHDVPAVLKELAGSGLRIGLISNSHRCLASFQAHFELQDFVTAAVSSFDHGFMKPNPSIFQAAMQIADVTPAESMMVGDSVRQDVDGAIKAGMRAVLLHRGDGPHPRAGDLIAAGIPIIGSLTELPELLRRAVSLDSAIEIPSR